MAGVTQTIPSYSGGVSEQPDQLKFPGQVKAIQNAIPDITYGLYKRPGAKRISANKLASGGTAIPAGGSWFHYYRDESEGSYIGQVASNGKVRIWSCVDGSEKDVEYDTAGQAYNGSDSDHTSITSYLTPSVVDSVSQTEDIQALTVNDTTFLNNRSKTVSLTGTTTGRPHKNFAYVELLRSENGRQYSLNIYDSDSTTNIASATRIKIASDTLEEGDGSGDCPGIGTQVFAVNSGSSKNLIFRITTLGQQGKTGSGTSNSDYQCSYNREVTLLHGGEYWSTGNVPAQTLTQAKSNYSYTINIEKVETVAVKANIKAVRPEPTPFDADTAVTVDQILGGIQGELSGVTVNGNALNYQVIGNGIYLYTAADADDFNVEVVDGDLMRVMQTEVNDVTNLPNQCKHGLIVKVSNTRMSDEDDYYVKFNGENGKDGIGSWIECPAPGIVKSFNATTMPHVLQRQANGKFLVKKFEWADRLVGDDVTNAAPSFAGSFDGTNYAQDQKINKVCFFRNRLTFLSGEHVITSRPGSIAKPDFWAKSALTVAAIDPIDIACASTFPSELFDAIEINTGLVCFSTNVQYLLSSDDTVLNPDTAKLRRVSAFNYNKIMPPINLGQTTAWTDNSGKYTRFVESANIVREGTPTTMDTTKLVPSFLPKDLDMITNSRENSMVFLGKTGDKTLYGYRYFIVGDERRQTAWFKWKIKNNLRYHFIIEDVFYFLDSDGFLQSINLVQADSDPSVDIDSTNYLLHIDNYTTVSGGSYSDTTKETTFSGVSWLSDVTDGDENLVIVDTATVSGQQSAKYGTCTVSGTTVTVKGNWSSGTLYLGYLYDYQVDFPRIHFLNQQGERVTADINSSLIIHRLKFNFGRIGLYQTTLTRIGKLPYTETYESTDLNQYDANDAPYLAEKVKTIPVYEANKNVSITLKSSHPAPATLRSMSWEGDYSPKYYRRG